MTIKNPWWLKNYRSKLQNLFGCECEPYSGRSSSIKPSRSKTEFDRRRSMTRYKNTK